jgi:hypothetical protein
MIRRKIKFLSYGLLIKLEKKRHSTPLVETGKVFQQSWSNQLSRQLNLDVVMASACSEYIMVYEMASLTKLMPMSFPHIFLSSVRSQ